MDDYTTPMIKFAASNKFNTRCNVSSAFSKIRTRGVHALKIGLSVLEMLLSSVVIINFERAVQFFPIGIFNLDKGVKFIFNNFNFNEDIPGIVCRVDVSLVQVRKFCKG